MSAFIEFEGTEFFSPDTKRFDGFTFEDERFNKNVVTDGYNFVNCEFNTCSLGHFINCVFTNCVFYYCKFNSVIIEDCYFEKTHTPDDEYYHVLFEKVEIINSVIKDSEFLKCQFEETSIVNTNIKNSSFIETSFFDCFFKRLDDEEFYENNQIMDHLRDSEDFTLNKISLTNVKFSSSEFENVSFSDSFGVDAEHPFLNDVDFSDARLVDVIMDDLNIDNVIASSGTSFQGSSINLYSDLLEIEEDNRIGQDNAEIMNRLQLTLKPSSRLLNRVSSSSKPRTTGGKGKSLNKKRRNHKKTNRNKKNKMKRTRRLRK